MGWYTHVNAEIDFSKETYDNLYQVESEIENMQNDINSEKENLLIYATSDPKNLIIKDCEGAEFTLTESIRMQIHESLENYETYLYKLYKLELLKENWARRTGDFVKPDAYYKYIGTSDLLFTPNKIYEVNFGECELEKCYFINNWYSSIPIKENKFNNFFIKSSKEEYDEYWRNHRE